MRTPRLTGCVAVLAVLAALAAAPRLVAQAPTPAGDWHGQWTSPSGYLYNASVHLELSADQGLQGTITWTLMRSPRPAEQAKIGRTGQEFVRGSFDGKCGMVRMQGYDKNDPDGILGLDRYALVLAENGSVLGGITWDNGPWTGQLLVTR